LSLTGKQLEISMPPLAVSDQIQRVANPVRALFHLQEINRSAENFALFVATSLAKRRVHGNHLSRLVANHNQFMDKIDDFLEGKGSQICLAFGPENISKSVKRVHPSTLSTLRKSFKNDFARFFAPSQIKIAQIPKEPSITKESHAEDLRF
jgi:hypothetical protein